MTKLLISIVAVGAIIAAGFELMGRKNACAHPPEDCDKPKQEVQKVVKTPVAKKKVSNKNLSLLGFQKRQGLKETGKWNDESLKSCKSICLKLGIMENEMETEKLAKK